MCNRGKTLRRLDKIGDSLKVLTPAEEIAARRFGDQHPITLLARANRGAALMANGDWQEARRVQEQVLEIQQQRYGLQHPETLVAMGNLALTLSHLSEFREAKRLQEAVLETRTQALGPGHPLTVSAMRDLAVTLFALKERDRSCDLFAQVYHVGKRVLGIAHPETLTYGSDLVTALRLNGQAKAAEAVEREQRIFGTVRAIASAAQADGQSGLEALDRTAEWIRQARERRSAGDYPSARESISQALRLALGGPETAYLGAALTTLGSIFLEEKRFQEAFDIFDGSRVVFHDLGQAEPAWTAYMWMGRTADEAGENERAIAVYETAYRMAKAGENWTDVNVILSKLGPLYGKTGNASQQGACQRELAVRTGNAAARRADTV
jgi:tetratricopeptide (TPR) repeat protein